ncbi:GspE/PulE family protein [Tundrisphaera lichenicola]|uniref:GspE/PulE family protein n=1 Tax=Tundrisphaera lichenicola TaxID=2029860 RepID=UPI003EC12CBD
MPRALLPLSLEITTPGDQDQGYRHAFESRSLLNPDPGILMQSTLSENFQKRLAGIKMDDPKAAVDLVSCLLAEARISNASDIHLQPTLGGLEVRFRIDGILVEATRLPRVLAPNVIARLKVLAELLTYRTDVPQEGRIREVESGREVRVSTFPTLHGEKAVIRLFAASGQFLRLNDLGLPPDVRDKLTHALAETSGAILLTGPAGSGKTTTIYACLRELVESSAGSRSLVTLEDPVEVAVDGVTQSQVDIQAGFDLATGLRSLLRQDPEVIVVGEIRDRPTAEVAFQASMTGHLVLSTFHAGSSSGAVARLADMGIEPYLIRSGLLAVVSQRLVRKLCECAREESEYRGFLGLSVSKAWVAVGCESCRGTGYRGRMLLAELLEPERLGLGPAILARADLRVFERQAIRNGMLGRWHRAIQAIEAGLTSPAEVRRVLGFSDTLDDPT